MSILISILSGLLGVFPVYYENIPFINDYFYIKMENFLIVLEK